MIYPLQIRAARALVGFSQRQLAESSGVGLATIKRLEAAGHELTGTLTTMARLSRTLEQAGVVFVDQDHQHGPGVRLQSPI